MLHSSSLMFMGGEKEQHVHMHDQCASFLFAKWDVAVAFLF